MIKKDFTQLEDYKNYIKNNLRNKQSTAIYALKHTGKTHLLNLIYDEMKEKRETIYINMEYIFNQEDLYLAFKSNVERIFNITFDDVFDDDLGKIEFIFNTLGNRSEMEKKTIYIFINDFEKFEDIQNMKLDLNKVFHSSFINYQNLIFCVTVSNTFGVDTFEDYKSILFNFCEIVYLKNLSEKELVVYIYDCLKNADISQNLVFYLMEKTNNMIYYIKKICKLLRCKKRIDEELIDLVIDEIYSDFSKELYSSRLDKIRGKKHLSKALYLIATDKNPYDVLLTKVGNRGNIAKIIKSLEKEGFIAKIKEPRIKYIVFDPFLKRYILENFEK